jgi:hypothetical protein
VLRERHVRTEERNGELKAQLTRVQTQLSEVLLGLLVVVLLGLLVVGVRAWR